MTMKNYKLVVMIIFVVICKFFTLTGSIAMDKIEYDINLITSKQWDTLSGKKIYFGHQSVGNDIINGINIIIVENKSIKIRTVESYDLDKIDGGAFIHSRIGSNDNVFSKNEDFIKNLTNSIEGVDIAFIKYCYLDIGYSSDVQKIFLNYKDLFEKLKKKSPNTLFVVFTVPLTTIQDGPKAWIKSIIGKPVAGIDDNVKRNQFNKLIVDEFQGKMPVFDIAAIEATRPDGKKTIFEKNGIEYFAMYKGYSDDGGHLNIQGQKKVAEQLLVFLAGLN